MLASEGTCWRRVEKRREATGRGVPAKLLTETVDALRVSVAHYVTRGAEFAERVLLYDNDADTPGSEGVATDSIGGVWGQAQELNPRRSLALDTLASSPSSLRLVADLGPSAAEEERGAALARVEELVGPGAQDPTLRAA